MSLPVSAFHFADVVGSTAAPPPIATRSREKSTSAIFGCIMSPPNSVLTPVKHGAARLRSISMKPSMSRGLGTSQFSAPIE